MPSIPIAVAPPPALPRPVSADSTAWRNQPQTSPRRQLGQLLVDRGALAPGDLLRALMLRARQDCLLSDILLAHEMVSEQELISALQVQWDCDFIDLHTQPPDPALVERLGVEFCLKHQTLPILNVDGTTTFACARPDRFKAIQASLPPDFGASRLALAQIDQIHTALLHLDQRALVAKAETRSPEQESCRNWDCHVTRIGALIACTLLLAGIMLAPVALFATLCSLAVLTLVANSALRVAAVLKRYRVTGIEPGLAPDTEPSVLPRVSILVPLFKEREIATHLVRRLKRLDYPKELLDICLVVEADDAVTRDAIATTDLPRWIRAIHVPKGQVRTKPRAMNFALDFCKGSIIGILDAEDAPEPDQIHKFVRHFAARGPEVACLQGILDYYNARTNWLSRCFTVEYATWFRVLLPGLEKLGLIVPLGGTTVFFRRAPLEAIGAWDAHNVTEDADLGVRLARHGYRTEIVETVTEEEANCRALPWVKQRSRWLKGFAVTWAVHMREPRKLLRQVGWWRFIGLQVLLFGTLCQFLLAPLLWSFWLILFGLPHPLSDIGYDGALLTLAALFLLAEAATISVGMVAVSGPKHRFLIPWVPTLHFYFPLGTLAAYKAMFELLVCPFYWDKTSHGVFEPTADTTQTTPQN